MNFSLAEMPLPLRFRPSRPMSDEELMRFCAANDALRVERDANGEILVMSPAGGKTGRRNSSLIIDLGVWARADGRGFVIESNTGFILSDGSMRSPDAAWIENSRWDALSEEEQERYPSICPDFVVELRSQSDVLKELESKMEQWMANGAKLAWMIDPAGQAVSVYRPGRPREVLVRPAIVCGDGPVAGFELAMTRIWE
jgi:Uma2 family endonuclease